MMELREDGLVYRDGAACARLSKMEFRLMKTLANKPGSLIGYEEIMSAVWGDTNRHDSVPELLRRLRKKTRDAERRFIQVRDGTGIVFYPAGSDEGRKAILI